MTAYEKLKLEHQGIIEVVKNYTDDGSIGNYLSCLHEAVEEKNKESALYCLEKIHSWYEAIMNDILTDDYILSYQKAEHSRNNLIISDLIECINQDTTIWATNDEKLKGNKRPIIFLSHCSDDKKYGHALRDYIIGLGVPNDCLIYTSHPMHKVPMGANIYDYLRGNITGNVFMIILWSDSYLESPACLNEMGAAWVAQKDYTNIYVPDFSFGNPKYHKCAVDTRKMGAVLNGDEHCKTSMIELKQKIEELFDIKVEEKTAGYLLDQFIKAITEE